MSQFNLRNFLTENKLTNTSRLLNEDSEDALYVDPDYEPTKDNDPRTVNPNYKPTKTGPLTKAIRTDVNMFMRRLNDPNGLTEAELIDLLEDLRDIAERYIRATLSD